MGKILPENLKWIVHSILELVQLSILKSNLKTARERNRSARKPGGFRAFQAIHFTSSEDSECEDGRGPKRKLVRLENTNGSMANAAQSESEGMEVGCGPTYTSP